METFQGSNSKVEKARIGTRWAVQRPPEPSRIKISKCSKNACNQGGQTFMKCFGSEDFYCIQLLVLSLHKNEKNSRFISCINIKVVVNFMKPYCNLVFSFIYQDVLLSDSCSLNKRDSMKGNKVVIHMGTFD